MSIHSVLYNIEYKKKHKNTQILIHRYDVYLLELISELSRI